VVYEDFEKSPKDTDLYSLCFQHWKSASLALAHDGQEQTTDERAPSSLGKGKIDHIHPEGLSFKRVNAATPGPKKKKGGGPVTFVEAGISLRRWCRPG